MDAVYPRSVPIYDVLAIQIPEEFSGLVATQAHNASFRATISLSLLSPDDDLVTKRGIQLRNEPQYSE